MPMLQNGVFTFEIPSTDLAKGLRPSKRNPRNSKFLVNCEGAVGLDNVLQVLDDLDEVRIDTSVITDDFPYPQLFVFTNLIIVCSETTIYELVSGSLVSKLGPVAAGTLWSAVDLYDYVYMSNRAVSAVRSAESQLWSLVTTLPLASAICNLNGQIFIGAPDVEL